MQKLKKYLFSLSPHRNICTMLVRAGQHQIHSTKLLILLKPRRDTNISFWYNYSNPKTWLILNICILSK